METYLKQAIHKLHELHEGPLAAIDCARYAKLLPPKTWSIRVAHLIEEMEQALKSGK